MAKPIIAACRVFHNLPQSVRYTLQELAHLADSRSGTVTTSYSYLASKAGCCRRTAIRHIARLIDAKIIRCQRFWKPGNRWGINRYQFVIRWDTPRSYPGGGDRQSARVPKEGFTGEKFGRRGNFEEKKTKLLDGLTPGSMLSKMLQGARQG